MVFVLSCDIGKKNTVFSFVDVSSETLIVHKIIKYSFHSLDQCSFEAFLINLDKDIKVKWI